MPAAYAHRRLGAAVVETLPAAAKKDVIRFRRLYNAGLQGPDFFFYHNPFFKAKTVALGYGYHRKTGREFFTAARNVADTEAARAYLMGVLCHYSLDALCHPLVREISAGGEIGHSELETEFDRFLLERDGRSPAHAQVPLEPIALTAGECETVARFYPPATPGVVRRAMKNMAFYSRLLTAPGGAKRAVLEAGTRILGKKAAGMVMTVGPNPNCAHLDGLLLELYRRAAERVGAMAGQLLSDKPLDGEFDAIFG